MMRYEDLPSFLRELVISLLQKTFFNKAIAKSDPAEAFLITQIHRIE